MKTLKLLILSLFIIAKNISPQGKPSDFKLVAATGGAAPWPASENITILANGQVEFFSSKGNPPQVLKDTAFTISSSQVQQIWDAVLNNNFFSLNSSYEDTLFTDGTAAILTITANGNTKQVFIKNFIQQQIQNIISTVNSNVPAEYNLNYNPPEKLSIVPADPCGDISGFSSSLLKKNLPKKLEDKLKTNYRSVNSAKDDIQIPHGGVEIGCEMSLEDAAAEGRIKLKSKGDYFGDAVSITGDNTQPQSCNTITIKLNLEFFGPCDNDANELKIVRDIYQKWNGLKTSDGRTLKMDIGILSHPGVTMPPGTPGLIIFILNAEMGEVNVWDWACQIPPILMEVFGIRKMMKQEHLHMKRGI